jgi:hypothetical protein
LGYLGITGSGGRIRFPFERIGGHRFDRMRDLGEFETRATRLECSRELVWFHTPVHMVWRDIVTGWLKAAAAPARKCARPSRRRLSSSVNYRGATAIDAV